MKNLCESNFCNNCCKNCRYLIGYLMKKVQTFSVFDFAVFKMCLICFGGWLATTFIKNAKKMEAGSVNRIFSFLDLSHLAFIYPAG